MSWKRIKTFLIILFLLINIYLISSTNGFKLKSVTEFDVDNISKTVNVIYNNYGIRIDTTDIPKRITNLNIINVDNIMFSEEFVDKYEFSKNAHGFSFSIATDTFSYNEKNAAEEIREVLDTMGIAGDSYKLEFKITDIGLLCTVYEYVDVYPLFNGRIEAHFSSREIKISGNWYFSQTESLEAKDTSLRMTDISGVLVDMAYTAYEQTIKSDASADMPKAVKSIEYGYYVSSYDENVISKSASAVPCYMIETDLGSKYYYDVVNGNLLKQED
ncbi:MAG: hypothetical protein II998_05950 [Clostridia bacterium]|nr:hypothetical protein [Clostridia bacterium]